MRANHFLIVFFCIFLANLPQFVQAETKTVCFGYSIEPFTVQAFQFHEDEWMLDFFTHQDNQNGGQQCAEIGTNAWEGMAEGTRISFKYLRGELIGKTTVDELRQTSNPLFFKTKKKVCFWRPLQVSVYLHPSNTQLFNKPTKLDKFTNEQCLKFESDWWKNRQGTNMVSFFYQDTVGQMRPIDFIGINEMRKIDTILHLEKKKILYFSGDQQLTVRVRAYANGQLVYEKENEKETKKDILANKQCLLMGHNEWPNELNDNVIIHFYENPIEQNGNKFFGTATVQLLRETGEWSSMIDLSQEVRHYYLDKLFVYFRNESDEVYQRENDGNYTLFGKYSRNPLDHGQLYFRTTNGVDFWVDANGKHHLIPRK
ncbi:hypothetical protein niasHT_011302 [Heterodera trifolii]|uniref:Uncharacterized protein n=1 Tax=Heterodera trifolii TaxID=157864 RepID=A0ABD2LA70_9BILA